MPPHDMLRDYLLSRSEKVGACWLWTGPLDHTGYGRFSYSKATYSAHRMSYTVFKGPIPPGMLVCHNCPGGDNRRCINPDHLFLGTHKDNMQDAVVKGRIATGDRNAARLYPERLLRGDQQWSHRHPEKVRRGERHGMAKLTEGNVREIRRLRALGGHSHHRLAVMFGVQAATIKRVIDGVTWAWLD